MAFPAITNATGSNPGPGSETLPDTVQLPVGNVWKWGVFALTLAPATIAMSTTAEQTFSTTGIGLLTTDFVWVTSNQANPNVGIVGARVSAADALSIKFVNATPATQTPSTTASYTVLVVRLQPNWVKQATGNQLDW
jgi:hypothetical protein